MELSEIIDAYDRAWRVADSAERRHLLELSLTDDAELVSPQGRWQGHDAIAEWIDGFAERMPGATVNVTSAIDAHHDVARYEWVITGQDGSSIAEGVDVCERGEDGRLRRVVMFFGRTSEG